ncbi:hypothetical protein NL676_026593 [Syzygium grande]|nr:hypothetical protein NL676_026593 [Syzygium grande]
MERPEAQRDHTLKQIGVHADVIAHVTVVNGVEFSFLEEIEMTPVFKFHGQVTRCTASVKVEFAGVTAETEAKDGRVIESAVVLPPCKLKVESVWRVIRVFHLSREFRARLVEVRVAGFVGVGGGGRGLNGVVAAIAVDFLIDPLEVTED